MFSVLRIRIIAAMFLVASVSMLGEPLRSPWDQQHVHVKNGNYSCPQLDPLPKDIVAFDYYSDAKHSKIDAVRYAAYQAAGETYHETMADAIQAAEKFRSSGNRGAAECVLQILKTEAGAQSMTGTMASNQSDYMQGWTIGGLAVSWLKVREAEPGSPEDREKVIEWFSQVAQATQKYFTARHQKNNVDGTNNHYYWAGFAVMSVGIAADNRTMFDWGVHTYTEALSRIQPDGSLPLEMDRGQRALHYHAFALMPLTSIAEMGVANHLDMYNTSNGALHRLVKLTASGIIDNHYFAKQAGALQDTPGKGGLKSGDVLWMVPYLRHYPDANMSRLLHSVSLKPDNYLGGYPPGYDLK